MGFGDGEYPEVITPAMVEKSREISTATIHKDIADTIREIRDLVKMEEAEGILARHHLDHAERKMMDFKASARPEQRRKRTAFVFYLRRLLRARGEPWMTEEEWNELPIEVHDAEAIAKMTPGRCWRVPNGQGIEYSEIGPDGSRALYAKDAVVYR